MMIKLEDFIPFLGKPASDKDYQAFVKKHGLNELSRKNRPDGGSIYLKDDALGMHRLFEKRVGGPKNFFESFLFTTVFFYNGHGYGKFKGILPFQIHIDDSRDDVLRKIKHPPSFTRYDHKDKAIVAMDRWDFDDYSLAVNYEDTAIRSGQITYPWLRRDDLYSADYDPYSAESQV